MTHHDAQHSTAQHSTAQHSTAQPLFRPEVTLALSQQSLGAIRLAQPLSASLIAAVAVLVAAALIAYLTLGSVSKKARVAGVTVPAGGSLSIAAPNAGVLLRSLVAEGQQVIAGQPLFVLSTARVGEQGEITALVAQQLASRQASLEAEQRLRNSQYRDKKQALSLRLANLATEASQLEQEISLAQRRLSLANDSLHKFQTLQASGYVSSAQSQQKQEELLDLASRLSNLQRNKLQLNANRLALQAEHAELGNSLAAEQAQLNRALASLQQEIAENRNRKASLITAAQAGSITTISIQPGQTVAGGQVLATLIPAAARQQLEAHLYAPSRSAGFVATGQPVLLRYQAYPYQKFGLQKGIVSDVSKTPFAPNELPPSLASTILSNAQQSILGFNSNEALYRIKVKLDKQTIDAYGRENSLKPGMTLEADVLQERRKIWEWVLEPVLAVAQQ